MPREACDLDKEHDDGGGVEEPGDGGDDDGAALAEQRPDLLRRRRRGNATTIGLIYLFIEGLQPSQPYRVTPGLFTSSNLAIELLYNTVNNNNNNNKITTTTKTVTIVS